MNLNRAPLVTLVLLALVASCDRSDTTAKQGLEAPPAVRYEANVSAGAAVPPAGTLSNPHKGDKQSADAGASLFTQMNCDGCHGGGALGWAAPSLSDGRWRYGGAEDEIFQSIFYGRPKGMPAFGGVLGTDGVWMLVTYLQSLPVPDAVPTQSFEVAEPARAPVKEATPPAEQAPGAAAATTAPTGDQKPEALMAKYGCIACHAVDRKVIGPAFKDVAAKYRDQKDAAAMLASKARTGSVGVWGQIPMPPNPTLTDEDIHKLVEWILSMK